MSKFLRLTGISGEELLIDKDLVAAVISEQQGSQKYRSVITYSGDKYYVKDSVIFIQQQLEED